MSDRLWTGLRRRLAVLCLAVTACSRSADFATKGAADSRSDSGSCPAVACQPGFHCEWEQCVPDQQPPPQPPPEDNKTANDPLASGRFVFTLDVEARRLVRIDSATLRVASFAAGLAPMDLAIVGSRELSVLLDGLDLVEILDHRQDPPVSAAFDTARSLSHLAVSPTGEHAIAYYDWDDGRAHERQLDPGNINQVSVLYLGDEATPLADSDARAVNAAVGFLPRDVRFAADGHRAVVIGKSTLTPIDLGGLGEIGQVRTSIEFDPAALEILVDVEAAHAIVRYAAESRIDVLTLADAETETLCLRAPGPVSDIAFAASSRLLVAFAAESGNELAITDLASATTGECAALTGRLSLGTATQLLVDPLGSTAVAFAPVLASEELLLVDLVGPAVRRVVLEKAVSSVAFAGDGEYALVSHMKATGSPVWNAAVEDPEISVDKAFGVSWLNLMSGAHRLLVSDDSFGPFSFVPAGDNCGATFQAVIEDGLPLLLRVSHAPGFDDERIELAATPLAMGYLPGTADVYVTEEHPWGRVTFVDRTGRELRHVTGFALTEY